MIFHVSPLSNYAFYLKHQTFQFNLPNLNQKSTECRSNIRMTAVFPEYMNKNLAEKQTNKLLECVLKQLK